jgi:hypothetical protein
MSLFRCLGLTKLSVLVRGFVCEYFVTKIRFRSEDLLAPRRAPNLEDHPLSTVRDCLFNIFVATLQIGGRSSIRTLRTRLAVVAGTHFNVDGFGNTYKNWKSLQQRIRHYDLFSQTVPVKKAMSKGIFFCLNSVFGTLRKYPRYCCHKNIVVQHSVFLQDWQAHAVLPFHCSIGYANAPHCYLKRTLPVLLFCHKRWKRVFAKEVQRRCDSWKLWKVKSRR